MAYSESDDNSSNFLNGRPHKTVSDRIKQLVKVMNVLGPGVNLQRLIYERTIGRRSRQGDN